MAVKKCRIFKAYVCVSWEIKIAVLQKSTSEKCSYSESFWSVFSPNAGKYGPEKFRIRTFFTQCVLQVLHG